MLKQFIPNIPLKLYHVTYSKKNFETLVSFKKNGVQSNIAHGFGQGDGFYVWTTLEKAFEHVNFQKENSDNYEGYPTIIILEEILDPINWDLDYEDNARLIVAFLHGYWDLFQLIPDSAIEGEGKYLVVSKCKKTVLKNIWFKFSNNSSLASNNYKKNAESTGIREAALLGKIFNYMQMHFTNVTEKYEFNIFTKMAKKGMGVKYVGKNPLNVADYMIEVNGKWLNKREVDALVKLKGVKVN